ncbi:hypothetical protein CONLIGDRAFT_661844 [Coniochaeta ligniaria NRRL 30616]|uniref:ER transporter 6TM N-terminal domain-containing protein n=1 Tax=Coniochaeta ligniaria NRRL 30616 TaxID=1408157 RepID=A0A1J7ILH9_9PEZI|nr:hypothetical protein CONLIGDRAFT_661844 [Coniochaeta ligniaria NRRL 30616]
MALATGFTRRLTAVKSQLTTNHLWQRMVKHTVAVTISVIIVIIPAVSHRYGPASYLAAMTAVFCHCSQRFGQMAQSLIFTLIGTLLGLGWAALAMYLSGLVFESNEPAAYTIRAIFLVVVSMVHGYIRSQSPRLFVLVWLFLLVSFTTLSGTSHHLTVSTATNVLYPILTAMAVLLIVNVTVFPEFSGKFLADTTIQTLTQTQTTLKTATEWFMEPKEDDDGTAGRANKVSTAGTGGSTKASRQESRLANLTAAKGKLRAKLGSCKSALRECMFEIEYAVVPSRSLKPISSTAMGGLVRNVNTLISACESKFVLMGAREADTESRGDTHDSESSYSENGNLSPDYREFLREEHGEGSRRPSRRSQLPISTRTSLEERLEHVKPQREIASGNPDVLETLLARVRAPVTDLLSQVDAAILLVVSCLAYCYDVEKLPAGIIAPKGIMLEELDVRVDTFAAAVAFYDLCFQESLSRVAAAEAANEEVYVMPSIETFLLASSLLSLRQAAEQVMQMLKHARTLVARRQARRDRRRLYWPRKINWNRYLRSGGERDVMTLPENARKEARTGKDTKTSKTKGKDGGKDKDNDNDSETEGDANRHRQDEEANPPHHTTHTPSPSSHAEGKEPKENSKSRGTKKPSPMWLRTRAANFIESVAQSEHFAYALKLTIAVMLVSWIAFYGPLNGWFNSMRVVWAPLQLVLVFEVAIGSSLWVFFVRAGGVIFGCLWGYASFEIGRGNLAALVVILVIGIIPSAYVQLGTPYVKAGMISIVSMCIVALSTVSGTSPAWDNFVKRLVAFLVGGTVALIVEVALYPVRARDRLVESLSSSIGHISRMQGIIATGSESPSKVTAALRSARLNARFASANQKAQSSLSAADTFLPFCLSEPRLKGSFRSLEPIYKEIIYVLQQIIDRMDNSISLRRAYGSSVLEDLNPHVYVYRRNVSAAITLTLFAVNEALTTKIPLPQFLPSCRLAQVRLINRVREVMQTEQSALAGPPLPSSRPGSGMNTPQRIDSTMIRNATEQKFLSWSAAAAGQMEIIEYLEELVDLTKLLVGVNAFRSGMLERPSYRNYADRLRTMEKKRSGAERKEDEEDGGRRGDDRLDGPAEPDEGCTISPVVSAPTVLRRRRTGSSGAFMGLQRSGTGPFGRRGTAGNLEKGRRQGREGVEEEEGDQLELPMALQRIGTRFKQERSLGEMDKSRSN